MNVVKVSEIKELESVLTARYDDLINKLRGNKIPDSLAEIYSEPHITINKRELRLAIDDFSSMLKEIKRLCR